MLKENFAESQPSYDLRKRSARTQYQFTNFVRTSSRTTADLIGGVAEAVAQASQEFSKELTHEGPNGAALTNSLIRGFVKGNVRFLEGIAKTTERIYEDLTYRSEDTSQQSAEPIDYERLARLVADQMRVQQEEK
ncbi:MAG: hypothetical protein JO123_01410 [Ktedonobacteraceae bacterium]|nr:hypothetical protein [Ktedonobacteraceae bacterium]